jgi:hypothetical protein
VAPGMHSGRAFADPIPAQAVEATALADLSGSGVGSPPLERELAREWRPLHQPSTDAFSEVPAGGPGLVSVA